MENILDLTTFELFIKNINNYKNEGCLASLINARDNINTLCDSQQIIEKNNTYIDTLKRPIDLENHSFLTNDFNLESPINCQSKYCIDISYMYKERKRVELFDIKLADLCIHHVYEYGKENGIGYLYYIIDYLELLMKYTIFYCLFTNNKICNIITEIKNSIKIKDLNNFLRVKDLLDEFIKNTLEKLNNLPLKDDEEEKLNYLKLFNKINTRHIDEEGNPYYLKLFNKIDLLYRAEYGSTFNFKKQSEICIESFSEFANKEPHYYFKHILLARNFLNETIKQMTATSLI